MTPILEDVRCCDFCNEFNAPYVWMFRSQVIPAGTDLEMLFELMEHPEWFACEECHKLLLAQDLVGLVHRNKLITDQTRGYFTKWYNSLLQNLQRN